MYFPDRGCVHTLLTPSVYATGVSSRVSRTDKMCLAIADLGYSRPEQNAIVLPTVKHAICKQGANATTEADAK